MESKPHQPEILPLDILPQPDDETCGPTCLHSVYRYWGLDLSLDDVIQSCRSLSVLGAGRGTLAVLLGIDALSRGFQATLYSFNLQVFDPTWFDAHHQARPQLLESKLREQAEAKSDHDPRFRVSSDSYLEFLRLGGSIELRDPTSQMIAGFIRKGLPVLTGLSATYLYRCAREFGPDDDYDDIRGQPAGHFVVVHGYSAKGRSVTIADPLKDNPAFESHHYTVSISRLVPAIMLGILTYDANLLVIQPAEHGDNPQVPA